jgi:hypothetical protein
MNKLSAGCFHTPKESEIKDMVKGKMVHFLYYRDKQLWYKTESNFLFPVPIDDIGNATFLRSDRAILFMRYIRKYIQETIKHSC